MNSTPEYGPRVVLRKASVEGSMAASAAAEAQQSALKAALKAGKPTEKQAPLDRTPKPRTTRMTDDWTARQNFK